MGQADGRPLISNSLSVHEKRSLSQALCPPAEVLASLKPLFADVAPRLTVKADTPDKYVLVTRAPSPFPQHKGHPLDFGSVRVAKSYVSLHLMPLYMCPALNKSISPALKKRMQGKTCFNFKSVPDEQLVAELQQLTRAACQQWSKLKWL